MIKAAVSNLRSQQIVRRHEKRKPILAAKILAAASTMLGWTWSSARILLLILAKGLYLGCQKPRMEKSAATIRMSHWRSGLKRKSKSRMTTCTALSRATFSSILVKETGHIAFMERPPVKMLDNGVTPMQ
jgi:hypothetical protein